MKYFFLIFFSLACFWLSAQSEYRTHTVQKGETIYGIGKNYGLTEQEIFLVNPNLNGARIKEGDIVVIPAKKVAAPQVINRVDSNYVKHQVQPKETLYGLSKRYGISIDEILRENPKVANGLEIGMVVFIPKKIEKPIAKVEEVKAEEGYMLIIVKPQETVYGLSKTFGLSESEFYRLNPHVKEFGLQVGQKLQVPEMEGEGIAAIPEIVDTNQTEKDTVAVAVEKPKEEKKESNFFLYQIKTGDRAENVAVRFGLSVDELVKLNPEAIEELVPGRFIILPSTSEQKEASVETKHKWISDEEIVEDEIRIALILPFFLSINDSLEIGYANPSMAPVYGKSSVAIEFYNGFKQAVDTLARLGLKIKVQTIDSDASQSNIERQKKKIDILNPHFIVGPLYAKNAEWLAKEYPQIPIISPLSRATDNSGILNLINCHTQVKGEWLGLAGLINEKFIDSRIVFVNPDTRENRNAVELIKQNLESSGTPNLIELWLSDGFPSLGFYKSHMNENAKKTIWVTTSEDQAFLNDFLRKMYSIKSSNMTIVATSKVLEANTIQHIYLSTLDVRAIGQQYVDYSSEETEIFIQEYRRLTNTEPTEYSFKGYDTGIYFTLLAARYGGIPISRSWPSFQGLGGGFNFIEANRNGPTNKYINELEVVDFTLQRVSNEPILEASKE
jgi:LysM repeat protein